MAQSRPRGTPHRRLLDIPRVAKPRPQPRVPHSRAGRRSPYGPLLPSRRGSLAALLGILAAILLPTGCDQAPSKSAALSGDAEVPVRVDRVAIDDQNTPVVVLEEEGGPRWLPIWVGLAEAQSIALQIEDLRPPRPNTHDLARDVIHGLRGRVARVVVTELRGGTYYAILDVRAGDELLRLDARPSDAIAIALRDGAPIFVRASLFRAAAGDEPEAPPAASPEPDLGRAI